MIISHIIGGLGNQMFQYAVGRAIALQFDQPLRLDISGFGNYRLHNGFELQRIFSNVAEIANAKEIRSILGWQSLYTIRRIVSRTGIAPFRSKRLIVEPHFHYWAGIKNVLSDCYLIGYWQSEKYFQEISTIIRNDFHFNVPFSTRNKKIAEQIDKVNAVSLHVRRGDYVVNSKANATHGLCSLDYYQAAIKYISKRVKPPHFFIFSDDINWVKEKIRLDFSYEYIDHNHGAESYNDMRLMSMCQHHIIANSSFSWWGAWLNSNSKRIVIAPKQWFAVNVNTEDVLPNEWVKI